VRTVESGERFYLHTTVSVPAKPGEEVDIPVKLHPADLLTLTGRVLDAQGKTVPWARVILFAGNAHEQTWIDDLYPMRRAVSSRAIPSGELNAALGSTETDDQGRWTIHTVRETAESLKVAFPLISVQAGAYSIGAHGDGEARALGRERTQQVLGRSLGVDGRGGARVLVRDLKPEPGKTKVEVDLTLGAPSGKAGN